MKIQLEPLTEEQAQYLKGLLYPVVFPSEKTDEWGAAQRHKQITMKPLYDQLRDVAVMAL